MTVITLDGKFLLHRIAQSPRKFWLPRDTRPQNPWKIVMHKSRNRANNVTKSLAIKIVASVNLICQGVGGIEPKIVPFSTTALNTLMLFVPLDTNKALPPVMLPPLKLDKKTSFIHSFIYSSISAELCVCRVPKCLTTKYWLYLLTQTATSPDCKDL